MRSFAITAASAVVAVVTAVGLVGCSQHGTTQNGRAVAKVRSSPSTPAPVALVDRVNTALAATPSAHEVADVHTINGRFVYTADFSGNGTRVTILTPLGTVKVIDQVSDVYVKGSAAILAAMFSSTVAQRSHDGTRWVLISASDEAYDHAQYLDLNPSSQLDPEQLVDAGAGPVIHGQKTRKLTTTLPGFILLGPGRGKLTVYAPLTDPYLPLEYTFASARGSVRGTFSRWNERVTVPTPAGAAEDAAA